MTEAIAFLVRNGYALLFAWVFAEQIGLPLPAIPLLLAAGALAGAGRLNFTLVLGLAILASLLADTLWYQVSRRWGMKVLQFLCRISLEPDSCVRSTQNVFARYGARSLLVAKFIPGLSTAAPPLAGIFGMRLSRFLLFDSLGALLWAGLFAGLGYLFSVQLEHVAEYTMGMGSWLILLLGGGLISYLAWKYAWRQRFLRRLSVARITPEELKEKLDAGEEVVIVDLRHSHDFAIEPSTIPRALRMSLEDLDQRYTEVPRDRDIVLYCT